MTYTCQNCGALSEDMHTICNPANEHDILKSCSVGTTGVCESKVPEMAYRCACGNVSATPEHLCKPEAMTSKLV